jgi:hypothetical protein
MSMPIPPLKASSVERALKQLLPQLDQIKAGPHDSTKYDLLWKGHRFPPKVVVSRAVQIEHGQPLPESEFSGGTHSGQANVILEQLGFVIVPKQSNRVALPLELFGRFGRKEIYATVGVQYDQQQRHLNVGLSPKCKDGGYFIFITLNKEELDPAHNYADEIFADQFIWVTRRDVTDEDQDYVNLRLPETRVSLLARTNPGEEFAYLGELKYAEHTAFVDPSSGRPQIRYVWRLQHPLPEGLLRELTFGIPMARKHPAGAAPAKPHFRAPSSFDELRKAYSYVLGTAERTVVPEHQNYQVRLSQFLNERNIAVEMEKNFVDVSLSVDGEVFIGEIKVTRNLTVPQAFRAALGQLLEYGYLLFPTPPHMIMFLDERLDDQRLRLASTLGIAVIFFDGNNFVLLNADQAYTPLATVFQVEKPLQRAESALRLV